MDVFVIGRWNCQSLGSTCPGWGLQGELASIRRSRKFCSMVNGSMFQGAQQECEAGAPINYAVLHPNEVEILSVDQGGSIRVWDLTANACSCELVPDGDTPMRSISVSSDGYLVVAANNKGVCYVWRRGQQGFEPLHKLQVCGGSLGFSFSIS